MTASLRSAVVFVSVLLVACAPRLPSSRADLSGRKVEIVEAGAGEVTVVFEAGLGNDWTSWDEVAVQVSSRARIFAYSRPGYGQSEQTSSPRTGTQIVDELRELLRARGLAPPYLLVGHSFGGTYQELFAKKYPEEVVGLVLVDARHRDFEVSCLAAGISGCAIPEAMVKDLPRVQREEVEAFHHISEEITAAGPFGAWPVRVLTSGAHRGGSPAFEALWSSQQRTLADEAANGQQVLFPTASHNLQVDQPRQVAQIILSLLPVSVAAQ